MAIAPPAQDPMVGRLLDGRYEVRAALAQGLMGAMYRGWQLSVSREVAIKIIDPSYAQDREASERFIEAARLACQLVAPSIVNVYDVGRTTDGTIYLVSELVRGNTLASVAQQRSMSIRRVVAIAIQLCDALDAAARHGIVHGDLKPTNIMLDDSSGRDVVKVIDFGLARQLLPDPSRPDSRRPMPFYTAPEQMGGAVDLRTDLYALGCLMHEMLTGGPPFTGATIEAVRAKHRNQPPPALPPNIPGALLEIVQRLLAKAPGDRFSSYGDLRARLASIEAAMPRVSISTPAPNVMPAGTLPPPNVLQAHLAESSVPLVAQPFAQPKGSRRIVVIAIVAILASSAGIAAYVLATS